MSHDPRSYLLDRFDSDAVTLRARAAELAAAPPRHGPDAAASERMAAACEDVAARLRRLPDDVPGQLAGLEALGPALRALADRAPDPYVRSVYGGAAARVADVVAKERAAASDDAPDDDTDEDIGDDIDEDIDTDDTDPEPAA